MEEFHSEPIKMKETYIQMNMLTGLNGMFSKQISEENTHKHVLRGYLETEIFF